MRRRLCTEVLRRLPSLLFQCLERRLGGVISPTEDNEVLPRTGSPGGSWRGRASRANRWASGGYSAWSFRPVPASAGIARPVGWRQAYALRAGWPGPLPGPGTATAGHRRTRSAPVCRPVVPLPASTPAPAPRPGLARSSWWFSALTAPSSVRANGLGSRTSATRVNFPRLIKNAWGSGPLSKSMPKGPDPTLAEVSGRLHRTGPSAGRPGPGNPCGNRSWRWCGSRRRTRPPWS